MPTATIDGHSISFIDIGSGPAIMMVPGFQMTARDWVTSGYPDLLTNHRVIIIDPLGHGRSSACTDETAYTPERVVAHTVGVLDALGIESAVMWGFSRGGMIVGWCGALAPERCRALVVGGTPVGAATDLTQPSLRAGERFLAVGDWPSYWAEYPVPLPERVTSHFERVNHPQSNAAVIRALDDWIRRDATFGLGDSSIPTIAYFGSGEVFADALREELTTRQIDFVEGPWRGHAETMMDAAGVVAALAPFLELSNGAAPHQD